MLKNQSWTRLQPAMLIAWQQAMDEGKNVADLKMTCDTLSREAFYIAANVAPYEEAARAVYEQMMQAPMRADYPYVEPEDYKGIVACQPKARHTFSSDVNRALLTEKLKGAWVGRIAGCLLGKPVEGRSMEDIHRILRETNNFPLSRYMRQSEFSDELVTDLKLNRQYAWADTLDHCAPSDDDTNYTVFALTLMQNYGWNFTSDDDVETLLSYLPMYSTCTAERIAYQNAACGYFPPETARRYNAYREWIGAQIRADFFGYVNPGDPAKAAELAWRDGIVTHVKNGVYGSMYIAAMLAAAAVSDDMRTIIETGLDQIPEKCRLREDVEKVLAWYDEGVDGYEMIRRIHSQWDENSKYHWTHVDANDMIVTMALLCGEMDFGKSICLAVHAGFDTDCNGATVGSIMGMLLGYQKIDPVWYEPFDGNLETSVACHMRVTADQLVEETLEVIDKKNS